MNGLQTDKNISQIKSQIPGNVYLDFIYCLFRITNWFSNSCGREQKAD